MRPNILLVVFDTARADAFEPYGASVGSSPTVAQLASSGLAHPAAFSTACWTAPAHCSLFSGHLPRSAGFGHVGGGMPKGFRTALEGLETRLLPRVLSDAGYACLGVSTNLWVSPDSGFDLGFGEFRYLTGGRNTDLAGTNLRGRARFALEAMRARIDDGATAVEDLLANWITTRPRQPFFIFVNLVECHSPYLPPKPWNDLGPLQRARSAIEAQRHLTFIEIWKANIGKYAVPADTIDRMRRLYAAAIRQLDDWLARVLSLLDHHGILDDTEVMITSDHGENIGDGDLMGHAFSLDDRLIRVPFVVSGPVPVTPKPVVSLTDIPRIITDVAGLEDNAWPEPPSPSVAVAQFDAPVLPGTAKVQEALAKWELHPDAERLLCTSFSCATDGQVKLIRRLGHEELFDLAVDPTESRPVPIDAAVNARYADRLVVLRAALDRAESEERDPPSSPLPDAMGAEDVDALEAQMRLLGYIE